MNDRTYARRYLEQVYQDMPEIFPGSMVHFVFNGKTRLSRKMKLQMRKVRISGVSYRLRPSFVLPYMRAKSTTVAHGLFLLRFGVPFWALAVVFGHNAMWWYRLFISLSRCNLVATTVYDSSRMPQHLLADEHHVRIRGKKAYVATTIAEGCILGAEASNKADEASLSDAYGVFARQVDQCLPGYMPVSVNTDGWWATQNAWAKLFPATEIIECFFHAYLKVRNRATKKLQYWFCESAERIWNCYRATTKRQCAQRIRRLSEWANRALPESPMKHNVQKLIGKKKRWLAHFNNLKVHRTSNMLDRLMRVMARHSYNSQKFHSNLQRTSMNFCALALIHNFTPSSPQVLARTPGLISPAARLNKKVFHDDWLQNLMIASSLGGAGHHRNPL